MKYLSIDLETSGLDYRFHRVLQFACILEDTDNPQPVEELPYLDMFIKHRWINFDFDTLEFHRKNGFLEEYHAQAIYTLKDAEQVFSEGQQHARGHIKRKTACAACRDHDGVDVGSVLWDGESELMNMAECCVSVGFDSSVKHRAWDDAAQVIKLLRAKYV